MYSRVVARAVFVTGVPLLGNEPPYFLCLSLELICCPWALSPLPELAWKTHLLFANMLLTVFLQLQSTLVRVGL